MTLRYSRKCFDKSLITFINDIIIMIRFVDNYKESFNCSVSLIVCNIKANVRITQYIMDFVITVPINKLFSSLS